MRYCPRPGDRLAGRVIHLPRGQYKADVKMLGIPDKLVEHGTPKELHKECGYDAQGIADTVREMMKDKVRVSELIG